MPHIEIGFNLSQERMAMVPEYRTAEVERHELATAAASALEFSTVASVTADGSEETLFDFEESRDYDLGVGD